MSQHLTREERERRDAIRRERDKQHRRAQAGTGNIRDVVPMRPLPDRRMREVSLAEFSEAMRKCPALRELAYA